MSYYLLAIALAIVVLMAFFAYPRNHEPQPTITQGIYGTVLLITGDCMPKPVGTPSNCTREYVSRSVYVREPATIEDMEGTHVPYLSNKTALVIQARSDAAGFYELELPPGSYSVFVEDASLEYCNRRDGEGRMCPVTFNTGVARHDIQIDHTSW